MGQHGQVGDDRTLDDHDYDETFDGQQRGGHGRAAQDNEKVDQDGQGDDEMAAPQNGSSEARQLASWDGLDPQLHGFDMNDPEQRQVGDDGREEGRANNIEVRDADDLGHDEGGGAHDRGHELAIGRGRDLHGSCLVRRKADFFHQGDSEGAGGHRVGDG